MKAKTLELDYNPFTSVAIFACRILLGLLFIFSGFVKANDYMGFGYKLEEYFYVFGTDFMVPFAMPLAWFISVFEIGLGVAIMAGFRMKTTMWMTLIMMLFFTWLTGFSHFTGKVTDCGCFGDALKITPKESFIKDIILTVMVIPVFLVRKYTYAFPNERLAKKATTMSLIVAAVYSLLCHEVLPLIDFRAYKTGTDLNICTTVPDADGFPKCKGWDNLFPLGGDFELLQGKTLMIVMYNLDEASPRGIQNSVKLANDLAGSGIQVAAATASLDDDIKALVAKYTIPYAFAAMDETTLKTIVRSSPGYMLLKDGVVIKKWHHNLTPTAETVKELAN
jgi:uncharacterized membrane protein YphA (DoxX/SURF4 family)